MAAAAMFDFGYQAFCDVIDVLLFKVATLGLLPNWVKIGRKMIERLQFFEIQDVSKYPSAMLNSEYN